MVKLKTSYIAYIQNYILIALLCIVVGILYSIFGETTMFLLIFFASLIICLYLVDEPVYKKIAYTYEIGEDSVVETRGIITKHQTIIPYSSVSDIQLKKGVLGRMFNFGDIKVVGFRGEISLVGIKNPEKIYGMLKKHIIKNKKE